MLEKLCAYRHELSWSICLDHNVDFIGQLPNLEIYTSVHYTKCIQPLDKKTPFHMAASFIKYESRSVATAWLKSPPLQQYYIRETGSSAALGQVRPLGFIWRLI